MSEWLSCGCLLGGNVAGMGMRIRFVSFANLVILTSGGDVRIKCGCSNSVGRTKKRKNVKKACFLAYLVGSVR